MAERNNSSWPTRVRSTGNDTTFRGFPVIPLDLSEARTPRRWPGPRFSRCRRSSCVSGPCGGARSCRLLQPDLDATVADADGIHVQWQARVRQAFTGSEAEVVTVIGAHHDAVPYQRSVERPPAMRAFVLHAGNFRAVAIDEHVLPALQQR